MGGIIKIKGVSGGSNSKEFDCNAGEAKVLVTQLCPILCDSMNCSLPDSYVHGILQARILEWVTISFSRELPNLGIKPRSPALWADSLLSEPPGKPFVQLFVTSWPIQPMEFSRPEYWSGSLSLLQEIFPTQGLNPGLPHFRLILYQLSHMRRHYNLQTDRSTGDF